MRAWKVAGKYPVFDEYGKLTHTDITLASDNAGYATFIERIPGDLRTKSDKELIALAHEAYFKSEYADRAMAESVQTVEELKRQSEAFAQAIEEAKAEIASLKEETLNEIKANTERNQEMIKLATLTLNDALMQIEELLENMEENHDETVGIVEETDRGGTTDE